MAMSDLEEFMDFWSKTGVDTEYGGFVCRSFSSHDLRLCCSAWLFRVIVVTTLNLVAAAGAK